MASPPQQRPIFYLDLLRCMAVVAVIAIHVAEPLLGLYGQLSSAEWLAGVAVNSVSRWAVPIFFMISGALLLSDLRLFNTREFLQRRFAKVIWPFLAWSLIYALVSGYDSAEWQWTRTSNAILQAITAPTWYHLWYFYALLPLYLAIPLLRFWLPTLSDQQIHRWLAAWLVFTLLDWFTIGDAWIPELVIYLGYLVLGWYLFNRDQRANGQLWLIAGMGMLAFNFFGTWQLSQQNAQYTIFFMGYTHFNTVVIAGMLFVMAQLHADKIQGTYRQVARIIAKYSLGIYLIHPLILIPVREVGDGYYAWFGSHWLAIPILSLAVLLLSLLTTLALTKLPGLTRLRLDRLAP